MSIRQISDHLACRGLQAEGHPPTSHRALDSRIKQKRSYIEMRKGFGIADLKGAEVFSDIGVLNPADWYFLW